MNPSFQNQQLHIAQDFLFTDTHTSELASLAYQKIKSLKLASIHSAFCKNHQELYDMVRKSLLNYVTPEFVLSEEGFFLAETEN
jgi:hypothetical protein